MGPITEAVEAAIKEASWIEATDEAACELALSYARYLDDANDSMDPEKVHKAHSVGGPNLQKTLESLGLTAVHREKVPERAPAKMTKRDELKAKRLQAKTA